MLYFLKQDNGSIPGNIFYITGNGEHAIGRGDCHLTLPSDQSVSRRHASIWIENGILKVKDLGSRYGTFINDGIEANRIINNNGEVYSLQAGDKIRFGMQWNIWAVCGFPIRTVTSNMLTEQKEIVASYLAVLNGQFVMDFDDACTHVTVDTIYLTVKLLCGLVKGIPIVTPQYWKDCVECVRNNRLLPDTKNYLPPLAEDLINKENINLAPGARRELFVGKYFLFSNERSRSKLRKMVEIAGGQTSLWSSFDRSVLLQNNVIVLRPNTITDSDTTHEYAGYEEINALLEAHGKRMIPEHEIALALWHCDCTTNCNPNFKVTSRLFGQMNFAIRNDDIIVTETNSMSQYPYSQPAGSQIIIPPTQQTLGMTQPIATQNVLNIPTNIGGMMASTSDVMTDPNLMRKRLNEDSGVHDASADKRMRLDGNMQSHLGTTGVMNGGLYGNQNAGIIPVDANQIPDFQTRKRKADGEDVNGTSKRFMLENNNTSNDVKNFPVVDPAILENIYSSSGWLSKTFLKMEIKTEGIDDGGGLDGLIPPEEQPEVKPPTLDDEDKIQIKVITVPSLIVKKSMYDSIKEEGSNISTKDVNFKKFKKIQPKKSNYIISSFTRRVCDGSLTNSLMDNGTMEKPLDNGTMDNGTMDNGTMDNGTANNIDSLNNIEHNLIEAS
ncbi:uncharacterized protein LOC123295603 [Chrysoperla carnea]|uniref:uncharacterized protein LOC123295603 n=1 Tax=Chrysoperla carnea TaxID=189513 RepID=UPI001D08D2D3|nr:uncharacterized protein LOC123295603 [Chrysoperla carnea]